ncbi:hypothetical protein ACIQ2D_21230 [Lysinibacillus sp. NPDC097287]|uniref:hypothetical protein n=1 Tax=Lysinibacillus sp. NPDC097287 TaxID=3364144 RepID=UPI0038275DBD
MKIEISKIPQMKYEEFLRFKMKGSPNSVFNIYSLDTMGIHMESIGIWMKKIDAFPIYFCLEITDTSDFELICHQNSLKFEYIGEHYGSKVAILEILNSESFSVIYPLIKYIGNIEDLVFWSSRKNCFTVEKRRSQIGLFELVTVNMNSDDETTVFSLTQAGLTLQVYSTSPSFDSYEDLVKSLPEFTIPINGE